MDATYTLQDLVYALADKARDLTPGTTSTTNAVANKMTVSSLAGRRPSQWEYSEVIFLEPDGTANGMTGSNPYVVTDYTDGVFTLDHAFGPGGVPQGVRFFIVRNHGQGNPYRAYLRELARAVRQLGASALVENSSLVTATGLYTYTIPTSLDTVYAVRVLDTANNYGPYDLRNDQWEMHPGRQLRLTSDVKVSQPWQLTLAGRKFGSLPAALGGTITLDMDEAVDLAFESLSRGSNRPADQAKGAALQGERMRTQRRYALPNERLVLP